jgi:uncharacterized phage-associated protein
MAKALEVAKVYLELASAGVEADPISNLRLQKLLYYAQGWSLALRHAPAFSERIEAWALGPVVPDVYHALKHHGAGAIPADAILADSLEDDDAGFVSEVWEAYKGFSATKLSAMTHLEEPWLVARGNRGPSEACNEEITTTSLQAYFAGRIKKASAVTKKK